MLEMNKGLRRRLDQQLVLKGWMVKIIIGKSYLSLSTTMLTTRSAPCHCDQQSIVWSQNFHHSPPPSIQVSPPPSNSTTYPIARCSFPPKPLNDTPAPFPLPHIHPKQALTLFPHPHYPVPAGTSQMARHRLNGQGEKAVSIARGQ